MNFIELLNSVTEGGSDYAAAKKLGITRQMFSKYRNGQRTPSDEMIETMAEIAKVKPIDAYLAVYAEKISNPQVAEQFRHLAA